MKKLLFGLMAMIMILSILSGCSKYIPKEKQIEPKPELAAAEQEKSKKQELAAISEPVKTEVTIDFGSIGFELIEKEAIGALKLGMTDQAVIKELGEAEKKSEAIVWGADGLEHQSWYYEAKGIELGMVKYEGNQIVSTIKLSKSCELNTSRGIGIGSTRNDVIRSYGKEMEPENRDGDSSTLIAGTVYGGVLFAMENDRVTSIFIGAAAE